ncbi:class I SAM-dependent methyltransferase [Crossiella sp. CA198]|uniref:class I SAM-dependent methyltransferase n=1 Tax=Crossiella sp. CA198 TaxID=3455607 RepID=UPI003F8D0B10
MSEQTYVLAHSAEETRRLATQARFYAEFTDQLLRAAGIAEGMHVLDVGCGAGDVTFQLARIVGPTGSVTGVDADAGVLAAARERAGALGLANVAFQQAELPDLGLAQRFDAAVGRLILLHVPDPVAAIKASAALVRPGGIVSFQDFNTTRARSAPALPLLNRSIGLIIESLRTMGRVPDIGEQLFSLFGQAGLPDPRVAVRAPATSEAAEQAAILLGDTLISVLPFAERVGILAPGEIDPATLNDRLAAEARATPSVVYLPELTGAWTRLPG